MSEVSFVLGGCKSGKSDYAQNMVLHSEEPDKVFVATCAPQDEEMQLRVERHQSKRGPQWRTVEAQLDLPGTIHVQTDKDSVLLVDCLGMWVANLLGQGLEEAECHRRYTSLVQVLGEAEGPIWLVSNEVGCGIVPEDALSRSFRDLLGLLNQRVAAVSDRVVWMVAGLPLGVKGSA